MKRETIAIHGGFDSDPTTKAVAVPIYQTAAYSFDSAEHGAALFNLEVPGYRYTRISNPTTDVLEQRVTELEGGVGALSVSSGQTALYLRVAECAGNGPQHRIRAAALRHHLHFVRAYSAEDGHWCPLRKIRPRRRSRGTDRRGYSRDILRNRRQSGRQCVRPRGTGAWSRIAITCR